MPGLNNTASGPASERTVDSIPTVVRPPSRIIATRSPKTSRTCCAVVGESSVNRLALGAAMGTPDSRISSSAMGMRGHPNADGVQPGCQSIRHVRLFRQYQCQRPRPKLSGQFFGLLRPVAHQRARHFDGAHVNDQWTLGRPAFRGVNLVDGCGIEGVSAQSVHGFRRKGNELADADQFGSTSNFTSRASLLLHRPRLCRCVCRPGTRASIDPDRRPTRDPHRRWKAWCDDPSPCDTAPARSCGSGCRN